MRIHGILCLACVVACGDDMTDSLTGGMTDPATTPESTSTLPTTGADGSADTTAADGSADGTADTGTTAGPPTTGTVDMTGTTTDTGAPDSCDPSPEFDPESVPLNEACEVDLQEGSFNPVIEWKYGTSNYAGPVAVGQIVDTDASGALDDNDMPIILLYQAGAVVALRGDGSGVVWQTNGAYGGDGSGVALGDLEGDGWPEVITAGYSDLCALNGQTGAQIWCVGLALGDIADFGYNFPAVADMDGDGLAEVTVGRVIVDSTGVVIATGTLGKGGAPSYGALSVPVDLDGDGQMELVTGNTAYDVDGNVIWENGASDGIVAIADFDLDGDGEIVSTTGQAVLGMETNGAVVWGPLPYPGNLGAPAADDLDGDGIPELLFAAQNSLVAMKWGGAVFWTAPITDSSGAAGPSLFDFEKDGYPEVLYADEMAIRFFSGLDGSVKFFSDAHASGTILEYPVVADVDNDDEVEIVLGHHVANAQIGALTVYGDADKTWPPGRKVWNQHAYSITNVGSLGEIPAVPQPNWPQYNNFRSADIGLPPGEYIDLLAELLSACADGCGGVAHIAARVRNAGNVEAPAGISVTLRAGPDGPVLATQMTTAPIPSGTTGEVLVFTVPAMDLNGIAPEITVDDIGDGSGVVPECLEDNNVDLGEPIVCPQSPG